MLAVGELAANYLTGERIVKTSAATVMLLLVTTNLSGAAQITYEMDYTVQGNAQPFSAAPPIPGPFTVKGIIVTDGVTGTLSSSDVLSSSWWVNGSLAASGTDSSFGGNLVATPDGLYTPDINVLEQSQGSGGLSFIISNPLPLESPEFDLSVTGTVNIEEDSGGLIGGTIQYQTSSFLIVPDPTNPLTSFAIGEAGDSQNLGFSSFFFNVGEPNAGFVQGLQLAHVVPEPSTLVLAVFGGALLLARSARRHRSRSSS